MKTWLMHGMIPKIKASAKVVLHVYSKKWLEILRKEDEVVGRWWSQTKIKYCEETEQTELLRFL